MNFHTLHSLYCGVCTEITEPDAGVEEQHSQQSSNYANQQLWYQHVYQQ